MLTLRIPADRPIAFALAWGQSAELEGTNIVCWVPNWESRVARVSYMYIGRFQGGIGSVSSRQREILFPLPWRAPRSVKSCSVKSHSDLGRLYGAL